MVIRPQTIYPERDEIDLRRDEHIFGMGQTNHGYVTNFTTGDPSMMRVYEGFINQQR